MERAALVIDVSDANFESEVVQRSFSTPVVVDFWAEWCGPCRQLSPILEKLTAEHQGEFILAKLDVDANPEVAASFGIRSMPTVVGIRDGKPVSAFQGLIPEADVRRFLAKVLPSEADELVAEAETFAAAGQLDTARDRLHAALDREARHPRALLALAQLDLDAGETEQGLRLLDRIPPDTPVSRDAERLAAEVRTRQKASDTDLGALRARLEAAPDDLQARLEVGQSLSGAGEYEEGLEVLLEVVERDRSFADEAARKAMLDVFDVLGAQHPTTLKFRADLAKILFR